MYQETHKRSAPGEYTAVCSGRRGMPGGCICEVCLAKRHPTLLAISDRQGEIDYWDEMDVGGRRLAGQLALGSLAFALILLPLCWITGYAAIPMLVSVAGAIFCARVWWTNPPLPDPRPEPLKLVPFSAWENRVTLAIQQSEPFRAVGACPGCGDVEAHLIREPNGGEPYWAVVIRQCSTCNREWAQQ